MIVVNLTSWFVKGSSTSAVTRLNMVVKFAIPPLFIGLPHMKSNAPALCSRVMATINSTVPTQLNNMWAMPVRLASLSAPMEQTMAVVMQVPRLMPIIRGYTVWKVKAPVDESA